MSGKEKRMLVGRPPTDDARAVRLRNGAIVMHPGNAPKGNALQCSQMRSLFGDLMDGAEWWSS